MTDKNVAEAKDAPPLVFISYSHDSPNHKQWVAHLASTLRANGVDVILDQWDLGLGDDLAKFMERGVREAGRVLMICSEIYVAKANDGEGGAGYEAMIVTGELIEDLGTNKFIPVIRQESGSFVRPRSVSTRLAVDFSDDAHFDEKLDDLLREIHRTPRAPKPPLGENPFLERATKGDTNITQSRIPEDQAEFYEAALSIARREDRVEWRRMTQRLRASLHGELRAKWEKYSPRPPQNEDTCASMMLDVLDDYQRPFALVLAGIESGNERFASQAGFLNDLLNPPSWQHGGSVSVVGIPIAIACVFNHLAGALYLSTEQLEHAVALARTSVQIRHQQSLAVWQHHGLTAWPEALGRHSSHTLRFLLRLRNDMPWLERPFGSELEYHASIGAYFMTMSLVEMIAFIEGDGNAESLVPETTRIDVPPLYMDLPDDVQRRSADLLAAMPRSLEKTWLGRNVSTEQIRNMWDAWMSFQVSWHQEAHKGSAFFVDDTLMRPVIGVVS